MPRSPAASRRGYALSGAGSKLLLPGLVAVGLLWLLALYNLGMAAPAQSPYQHSLGITRDAPLHVSSDYSLSLKRSFSRSPSLSASDNPPEPLWLAVGEFPALVLLLVVLPLIPLAPAPRLLWLQWLSLNVPRAPPPR